MKAPQAKTLFILALIVLFLALGVGSCYWATSQLNCLQGRCPASESKEDIAGGVRITLWSSYTHYQPGENFYIRVTVENISSQLVILKGSNTDPILDIQLSGGGETFYWSEEHPELAVSPIELQPGEKFETEWKVTPSIEDFYTFRAYVWLRQGSSELSVSIPAGYGTYVN